MDRRNLQWKINDHPKLQWKKVELFFHEIECQWN